VTYVAEPYLYVADQVLTALTGGVARETHRFFAGANAFSFERGAAQVLVDSVRVIGQANEAFFAFLAGVDFAVGGDGMLVFLASAADPRTPANGATWPDEASEFFVSYYHTASAQAPLTDRNVGSLTRTLGEAFARELAVLRSQLELVYRSAFVDTAQGPSLDMVVALLGLTRKSGQFGSGTVRFFRDVPAPADVFIPAGTKVSTALAPTGGAGSEAKAATTARPAAGGRAGAKARPVSFVTTADRTLRRGQIATEAPVRAVERGASGAVEARTITVVNQTVLGISGVMNDAPTVFGGAGESDEELRRRAKTVAERAGRATPRAIVNALTDLGTIKANDVNITEDLLMTPGVVSVSVALDPTPELAVEVHDAILATRAAGIRVVSNLDQFLPATPAAAAAAGEARDHVAPVVTGAPAAGGGDFRLALGATVVVFPENPRITGAPRATLAQSVLDALKAYVDASSVGAVLVYNRLAADLMGVPGVFDIALDIVRKDTSVDAGTRRNIFVPADQRATIAAADIVVTFAGAPVFFDVQATVTAKDGATTDAIRGEIKARLADYFALRPNPIAADELLAKLAGSGLFDLAAGDLRWSAEYEQAGLVVHAQGGPGATTTLAVGDQAILRGVSVELKV
jgi:uncharacterized phage protein gp47/JayE